MIKILFICHGNICRSTMAQFVFQNMVNQRGIAEKFFIDSKATSTEELGNPPHRGTIQKMKEMNVPLFPHYASQLSRKDYDDYDFFIGMDSWNIKNMNRILGGDPDGKVYKLLHFCDIERDIADPWYTGNFDRTYEDVLKGCEGFLDFLLKHSL